MADKGKIQAEYIWLDGQKTPELRSKTRILSLATVDDFIFAKIDQWPEWGFDGSSTYQAKGHFSDLRLKPVGWVLDPIRRPPNILVMCEVLNLDGSVHSSNTRRRLAEVYKKYENEEPQFGIEQEYTLFKNGQPLAWVELNEKPSHQGRYYCGVGADRIFGRSLIEAHTAACLKAGLAIWGTNAEVMPSQWEFQIGPLNPLEVADQLWIARWLLQRLGEEFGITVSFAPKPKESDWNGAGAHTNFSTKKMREKGGIKYAAEICEKLKCYHKQHIAIYGEDNEKRLTGQHETCDINTFRYGKSDRGASVRIPMAMINDGCGYLEDRRPAANMDPYKVCTAILETVCGNGFKPVTP